MTIQFTPVPAPTDPRPLLPPKPAPLLPAPKAVVEAQLFTFVLSLTAGQPQTAQPLLVTPATLTELYRAPHPDLQEALRRCLDGLLVELHPKGTGLYKQWPLALGVTLALYTSLLPVPAATETDPLADPLADFGAALLATLPPARTVATMMIYHALLRNVGELLPHLPARRAAWLNALLDRSPVSAVYHLHHYTPPPLTTLAATLLRGWEGQALPATPWADLAAWRTALVRALAQPRLAAYLHQRWLTLPATRTTCRNLGLLLEALRQAGEQRALLLTFYEAWDQATGQSRPTTWGRYRHWPLLEQVETLLRADGDSAAAVRLRRWGSEYALLFYPLIQTIIADGAPPNDFNLLTPALIQRAGALVERAGLNRGARLAVDAIEYSAVAGEEA